MASRRDNQGRDLEAFKKQLERDEIARVGTAADAHLRFQEKIEVCPLPDWTYVDGMLVLRSGKSNFVAVPITEANTQAAGERATRFDVISLEPRDFVTQLRRSEVRSWLWRSHCAEAGV